MSPLYLAISIFSRVARACASNKYPFAIMRMGICRRLRAMQNTPDSPFPSPPSHLYPSRDTSRETPRRLRAGGEIIRPGS